MRHVYVIGIIQNPKQRQNLDFSTMTMKTTSIKMIRPTYVALLALAMIGASHGFVAPSTRVGFVPTTHPISGESTQLFSETPTGWDSFRDIRDSTDVPSGDEQRKFRRTVYTHDDWKKHRSPDRFIYYLAAIFKSGVYKNLGREVTATTAVATFVFLYNIVTGGYIDLEGVKHGALISSELLPKIGLPLAAFSLTSPSLGLLLGKLNVHGFFEHELRITLQYHALFSL